MSETREYFFVSDLHFGGDEQLKILDFEEEFVEFLKSLEEREVISRIRKAAPASSRSYNAWSPASQGATHSKISRKERWSGSGGQDP